MSVRDKLELSRRSRLGCALTSDEAQRVVRTIDVLRRVADMECQNPQREAADILQQIDQE